MMVNTRGMGTPGNVIVGAVGGTAAATAGTIFSSTALMSMLGISAAAGPVGLAVAGLVAAGAAIASALGVGSGCGQACINASNIVNQAEPTFKANLDAYENGTIDQATAISNFNQMWVAIQQACAGIPGGAGTNCVADRQQGACKWKATSQPYPSSPAVGECWNWYSGYYTPLTYPPVNASVSSTSSVGSSVSDLVSTVSSNSMLMIVAVVGIAALAIGSKN